MAIAAFTQSLTAQQIVRQADRDAGDPGLYLDSGSEAITAYAYVRLQALLDQLALADDWPFRNDRLTVAVSSRLTTLPDDYWRASFPYLYIYDTADNRLPLRIFGEGEMHSMLDTGINGTTGMPTAAGIMLNRGYAQGGTPEGVLIVDPTPDRTYSVEFAYQPLPVHLTAITDKPWFPFSLYLIKALACELFGNQDDQRAITCALERDKLKREIQRTLHGPGMRDTAVSMSPRFFRRPLRIS